MRNANRIRNPFQNRLPKLVLRPLHVALALVLLLTGSLAIAPPSPVQADTGGYGMVNLAKNKPVTPLTNTVMGSLANINDGNIDSVWFSYQGWPISNSFILDLGSSYSIGRVDIMPAQTHGFTIYTSEDGITYTPRYSSPWSTTSVHSGCCIGNSKRFL